MKDLIVDEFTVIIPPDETGDIEIDTWTAESGDISIWVPFGALEEWVVSIRKQIITNAAEAQKTGL